VNAGAQDAGLPTQPWCAQSPLKHDREWAVRPPRFRTLELEEVPGGTLIVHAKL
jgi:hypothetical protein